MTDNSDWLTKDAYIYKKLLEWSFTILVSAVSLIFARTILFRRDRKIQELDRSRAMFDELRQEFVQIINDYYKVRKRYETMREAIQGKLHRNPYILQMLDKKAEKFDSLLSTCISLEGQYYTLMERYKISFSELWENDLVLLMERKDKTKSGKEKNDTALEFYFDRIRDSIEKEEDIDNKIKADMEQTFRAILIKLNKYEVKLLVVPKN